MSFGRGHPTDAGDTDCHVAFHAPRNDMEMGNTFAGKSVLIMPKPLSLRTSPQAGVAIRSPAMQSIASAIGRQFLLHETIIYLIER